MATGIGFEDVTVSEEEIEFQEVKDNDIYSEEVGVLKFKDAQRYLRLSKAQLYLLVKKRKVPFFHLDSETKKKPEIRFVKATLDAWLKQREAETMAEKSPVEKVEEKMTINNKDIIEELETIKKEDGWVSLE